MTWAHALYILADAVPSQTIKIKVTILNWEHVNKTCLIQTWHSKSLGTIVTSLQWLASIIAFVNFLFDITGDFLAFEIIDIFTIS